MGTTEHTINDAIADLLRGMKATWAGENIVLSETTGLLQQSGRPDIIIQDFGVSPVVIETEVFPAVTVEEDAKHRLGRLLTSAGKRIFTAVAVRMPVSLRDLNSGALKSALQAEDGLEYAIFSGTSETECSRWPQSGWMTGDLAAIAMAAQAGGTPENVIAEAANRMEIAIAAGAARLQKAATQFPASAEQVAAHLHQESNEQTQKMAVAILMDALVFHESLAGRLVKLPDLRSIEQLRGAGAMHKPGVLREWQKILSINYWPVFDIARRILESVPTGESQGILDPLCETAVSLVSDNLIRTHDLTGTVFQRLISDREFLAAYYTTPASAALMAGLLMPRYRDLPTGPWSSPESITNMRVGDFACGTGTLLASLYDRISRVHELNGGSGSLLHAAVMNDVLFGYDILPTAAHLTASTLSGTYPDIDYGSSNIFTLAYGGDEDGNVALGSIDLLDEGQRIETLAITSQQLQGTGATVVDARGVAALGSFNIVAMNPPFKRPTGNEGISRGQTNPMFAAFGNSQAIQSSMTKATKRLTRGTCYDGKAGLASAFIAIAERKLAISGRLGLILPLTFASGSSWQKSRDLLQRNYSDINILSIVGDGRSELSFSADTGMAECMVIATKSGKDADRATFTNLLSNVASAQEATAVAEQVNSLLQSGGIPRLEDGPIGGAPLKVGSSVVGHAMSAPLKAGASWQLTRISDLSLAQAAFQMIQQQRCWIPSLSESSAPSLPICPVEAIGEVGPYHMNFDVNYRGAFSIGPTTPGSIATYPILWSHEASRERSIQFEAFEEGVPASASSAQSLRENQADVEAMWATASHLHFNRDFRLNSQSTAFQFSARAAMGGHAWPSIQTADPRWEMIIALWGNTSLSLLLHWFVSNRQQPGRARGGVETLRDFPVLDVSRLTESQLESAVQVFDAFKAVELLPAHLASSDENRQMLDHRFLTEVLGFDAALTRPDGPLQLLREKFSSEPSVHGGKDH